MIHIDANENKQWWVNDKLSRLDGPAIENSNGNKEWYIKSLNFTKQEFNSWTLRIKHCRCPFFYK